jgi:HAD superfamily hydrolase (TIGR01484 family)
MQSPIKLISTDFDGTLFAEFENPPVPDELQAAFAELQRKGVTWVINTGRDLSSLMETLGRSGLIVEPDYLVLVEREIHCHQESKYEPLQEWNQACHRDNELLFQQIRPDIPKLMDWINARFHAILYEDNFSPFCLIARDSEDADEIHRYLEQYGSSVPDLTIVRNDVYARFAHARYNKGTALAEVARRLGARPAEIFAVGDHLNDLPMLQQIHAQMLACPANAVAQVKSFVRAQGGYVSAASHGSGVLEALNHFLQRGIGTCIKDNYL